MAETLHLTRPSAYIALIEIDNPPANALGAAIRERFMTALEALDADLTVRAVILTGRGKVFCGGDDLKEAQSRGVSMLDSTLNFARLLDRVEQLRMPVVAAINGPAAGGGLELALACDIRIAARDAKFICAGVNVGLMASVYRLPRLIGVGRAKSMLLTGLPIDAPTALAYGLITEINDTDALMQGALLLADRIASRAPLSVEASKRMSGGALDMNADEVAAATRRELEILTRSADHRAAVDAFVTRQEAKFTRS